MEFDYVQKWYWWRLKKLIGGSINGNVLLKREFNRFHNSLFPIQTNISRTKIMQIGYEIHTTILCSNFGILRVVTMKVFELFRSLRWLFQQTPLTHRFQYE